MPVTADLKGKAAQSSSQVKILREKAKALGKGDFAAVSKLTSEAENRRNETIMEQMGDQIAAISKEASVDLEKSLKTIQRVIVRGDRAVVIFANKGWTNFVKEGGQWKSDD
jgi:predicted transcriptional regulator